MKEKHISPSEALRVGVLKIIAEPYHPEINVEIAETEKTKRAQIAAAMQAKINELNDEIDILRKKDVVQKA